jgi:hypothetical protein
MYYFIYFFILLKKFKTDISIYLNNKYNKSNKSNSNIIIKHLKTGGVVVKQGYIPYSDFDLI